MNLSISDTISLPLGGGTVIHVDPNDQSIQLGPDSVAYRLEEEALAFGGQTITATDIALAAGLATGVSPCSSSIRTWTLNPMIFRSVIVQ